MKEPFLSLYVNHTYHVTYNVQLYSSEKEYSEVFILYFVYIIFKYQLYPAIKEMWREQTLIKTFH